MVANWLIRTSNNSIIGPLLKEQVIELINQNKLSLFDEVCQGNGYWFFLKEEDLVQKYLYGEEDQGFNPVSEAEDIITAEGKSPPKKKTKKTKKKVDSNLKAEAPIIERNEGEVELPIGEKAKVTDGEAESKKRDEIEKKLCDVGQAFPSKSDLEFPITEEVESLGIERNDIPEEQDNEESFVGKVVDEEAGDITVVIKQPETKDYGLEISEEMIAGEVEDNRDNRDTQEESDTEHVSDTGHVSDEHSSAMGTNIDFAKIIAEKKQTRQIKNGGGVQENFKEQVEGTAEEVAQEKNSNSRLELLEKIFVILIIIVIAYLTVKKISAAQAQDSSFEIKKKARILSSLP